MKTAKQLGLSRKEHNALVKIQDGLASGRYKHIKRDADYNWPEYKGKKPLFNMNQACTKGHSCGTVACIGGWMALEMKMSPQEAADFVFNVRSGVPKYRLFYPEDVVDDWDEITPKKAARAIGNFLETGDPQWDKVAA